jgi:hypothetical protein
MAVQDTDLNKKWVKAYDDEKRRRGFYDSVKRKYPGTHPLVQDAKAKYEAARARLDKVFEDD